MAEGRAEAIKENARKMKALGSTVDFIAQVTGLTAAEIEGSNVSRIKRPYRL